METNLENQQEQKPSGRPDLTPLELAKRVGKPWALTVVETLNVTPKMLRVIFHVGLPADAGDDFNPKPGQELMLQIPHDDVNAHLVNKPARRHYTIRSYDAATRHVSVDFVMHGNGLAVNWAHHAKTGDTLNVMGPRGRSAYNSEAAWHLMSGDETCIPYLFANVEAMPASAKVHLFVEVADEKEQQPLKTAADVKLTWLSRNGAAPGSQPLLVDAIAAFTLPEGRGQVSIIGETDSVRSQRVGLLARGLNKEQIAAQGYWRPGRFGGHDHVDRE